MKEIETYYKIVDYSFKICLIYYFIWMILKTTIFNYSYDLYLFSQIPVYFLISGIVTLMMFEIGYNITINTDQSRYFYLLIVMFSFITTMIIIESIDTYLGQIFSFFLAIIYLVLLIECKNYYNILKKIQGK